jgi:hypothetical protein
MVMTDDKGNDEDLIMNKKISFDDGWQRRGCGKPRPRKDDMAVRFQLKMSES